MNADQTTILPVTGVESIAYTPAEWDALPSDWGPYEGVSRVAQGGMGMVYRAVNKALKRVEAIKVLRSGQFAGPSARMRFRIEAEAAAGLTHPNFVPIYGGGEVDDLPYFAMKWVDGGELGSRSAELRANPTQLARVMGKVEWAKVGVASTHMDALMDDFGAFQDGVRQGLRELEGLRRRIGELAEDAMRRAA